ncbi:hypothetical protein Bca101_080238 [Brassica carinata]
MATKAFVLKTSLEKRVLLESTRTDLIRFLTKDTNLLTASLRIRECDVTLFTRLKV